jgi:hypothetical protein
LTTWRIQITARNAPMTMSASRNLRSDIPDIPDPSQDRTS